MTRLEQDYQATTTFLGGVLRAFEGDARGEEAAYLRSGYWDGRFEPAYMNLGLAYARAGRRQKALEVFRQVLKINPGNSEAASFVKELEDR